MKDGWVRAETLPLVMQAVGAERLPRGARVRVRIGRTDPLTLEAHGNVIARLDDPAAAATPEPRVEDDELESAAAPLALAIDLQDADDASAAPDPSSALPPQVVS